MPHKETRTTTTDFFELALGVRTWLLQISGAAKVIFLPEGVVDFFERLAAPGAPSANRLRLYSFLSNLILAKPDGSRFVLWRQETVRELSAAATLSFLDWAICTGSFTLTLPDITADDLGRPVRITNVGIGSITVDGDGADTIGDGVSTSMVVLPGDSVLLLARSVTDWRLA